MLVLSRKFGESIRIGDEIELKVVGIRNRRVRIGIRCPRDVVVNRIEVHECGATSGQIELERRSDGTPPSV